MSVLSVLKTVGTTALKGLKKADEVLEHPAIVPLTMMVPWGWAKVAMTAVRRVNDVAQELRELGEAEMSDEEKRTMFAEEFRKVYPDAKDNDLQGLAAAMLKVEKGELDESYENSSDG